MPRTMRPRTLSLVVLITAAAFATGWWSAREPSARPTPEEGMPKAVRVPEPVARGLLCVQRGQLRRPDSGCEHEQLRATWCEGQLSECERSREAVRQPWPEHQTVEDPVTWTQAVEEALVECDIAGAEVEAIDCAEYPCVAAFRPTAAGEPDSLAFSEEQERLIAAVRACAPLREAFGVQTDEQEQALDVFANDATCPDGSRADFFALMALDTQGDAYALLDDTKVDRTKREQRDLFRWLFRRGDDVAAQYPCDINPPS